MTTPLILCSLTIQVGFLSNYLGVFLWCKDLANNGGTSESSSCSKCRVGGSGWFSCWKVALKRPARRHTLERGLGVGENLQVLGTEGKGKALLGHRVAKKSQYVLPLFVWRFEREKEVLLQGKSSLTLNLISAFCFLCPMAHFHQGALAQTLLQKADSQQELERDSQITKDTYLDKIFASTYFWTCKYRQGKRWAQQGGERGGGGRGGEKERKRRKRKSSLAVTSSTQQLSLKEPLKSPASSQKPVLEERKKWALLGS